MQSHQTSRPLNQRQPLLMQFSVPPVEDAANPTAECSPLFP